MAESKKKAPIIFIKTVGHDSRRFQGKCVKESPIKFSLELSELISKEVKEESEVNETRTVRTEMIRPLSTVEGESIPADEIAKRQTEIDKFLQDNSIAEALEEVEFIDAELDAAATKAEKEAKKDADKKKAAELRSKANESKGTGRRIEMALDYPVQRYLDEQPQVVKVPIVKTVTKVTEKEVDTIPFYFRPTGQQVYKSIVNYLKSE